LPWSRRERWAKQIVQGLSEIHEAGFVQGDFTLSNIVIDAEDKAKIIDINRRGCPVGWEPPEVAALIESKQRISMYIGVKSDIFQLGMVLWAIAMEQDEPEIQPRPLTLTAAPDVVPSYYRALVGICLSDDPRNRIHATSLLGMFPDSLVDDGPPNDQRRNTSNHHGTQYIDPAAAVGLDDIANSQRLRANSNESCGPTLSRAAHTYGNSPSDTSVIPYFYPTRGRSPPLRASYDVQDVRIVTVSPSRHHTTETQLDSVDSADEVSENPRTTEAVLESIPGDLAGIGEHSTLDHADLPQGIAEDDMTTDVH